MEPTPAKARKSRGNAQAPRRSSTAAKAQPKKKRVAHALVGKSGRTNKKADRRLEEIVTAAASVFARHGYHGASTQDIADVLKIKQASLYYYVPSKEAALETVCARGAEGFFEDAAKVASQPGSASDKIIAIARLHLLPLLDRRDFVMVFLKERRHLPRDSRVRIGQWINAYEKVVEDIIRAGMASGEFRANLKPRLTALGYIGMLRTVADWYGKEPGISLDDVIVEFPTFFLGGIQTP